MTGSRFTIAAAEGNLQITQAGRMEFSATRAASRLGSAMEWMEVLNTARLAAPSAEGAAAGTPLHAAYRHGPYSLWQCWLHELYFPYLTAYAQFQDLFEWLESAGWPHLDIVTPLPGDLRKALAGAGLAGTEHMPGAAMTALEGAARFGLPPLWRRSARRRGSRVLVYTPDIRSDAALGCDFRFSKVYSWLAARGVPISEIFHLTDQRLAIRNARGRGRIPAYLELWYPHPRSERSVDLSLDALPPSLQSLIRRILPRFSAYCRASGARIQGLKGLLRESGLKLLLGMDDFRSNNELLIACRETGIRTVLVQHGLITRFHPGWMACGIPEAAMAAPDRYLVRAPFWKSVLDRYAPRLARVATVAGGLDGAAESEPESLPPPRAGDGSINVLLVAETLWDPREAVPYVDRLLRDPRLRLHFKIRPDVDAQAQIRPYFGERQPHQVVLNLDQDRERIDIVLGSHSSLIYKLLEWRKPVFRLKTSFEYGEQLDIFGLTDPLGPDDDPHALFQTALERDPRIYAERWAAYRGDGQLPDYRAVLEEELDRLGRP